MNTICKGVLNKHFKQKEVTCGIGIDYGRMLATKTGVRFTLTDCRITLV